MDTEFDIAPSEPKRARVGRQARDILDAIERDTTSEFRMKNLRSALARLGDLRTHQQDIAFATLFKNQAISLAAMIAADYAGSVLVVIERFVRKEGLSSLLPLHYLLRAVPQTFQALLALLLGLSLLDDCRWEASSFLPSSRDLLVNCSSLSFRDAERPHGCSCALLRPLLQPVSWPLQILSLNSLHL